jgi:Ras-related protein Rab-8A
MGILLVYDVSDANSFTNVRNWMRQIDSNASENVNRILIGNKADVDSEKAGDRVCRYHSCIVILMMILFILITQLLNDTFEYFNLVQRVTTAEGKALAEEFGIKFYETSAKLNLNVDTAFMSIAKDIVDRLKENPEHYGSEGGNVNLQKEKLASTNKKSCC